MSKEDLQKVREYIDKTNPIHSIISLEHWLSVLLLLIGILICLIEFIFHIGIFSYGLCAIIAGIFVNVFVENLLAKQYKELIKEIDDGNILARPIENKEIKGNQNGRAYLLLVNGNIFEVTATFYDTHSIGQTVWIVKNMLIFSKDEIQQIVGHELCS